MSLATAKQGAILHPREYSGSLTYLEDHHAGDVELLRVLRLCSYAAIILEAVPQFVVAW